MSFNGRDGRLALMSICVALWFLLLPLHASSQEITLRLIDAKSGKPLRKVPVTMFSWNGPETFRPDKVPQGEASVHQTTDVEGRAIFRLSQPIAEHIGFSVGTPWDFAGCWHLGAVSPEAVLRSGVAADYNQAKCGQSKVRVSAEPGEVVISERKLTLSEKIHREIPK